MRHGEAEPHVRVSVRPIASDGRLEDFFTARIALTHLGNCRLGSILVDARTCEEFDLPTQDFVVDFTPNCVELNFKRLAFDPGRTYSWFGDDTPAGPAFRLPLASGGLLWIPCMEFFSRCYGASQEVKRILALYGWADAAPQLFAHGPVPSSSDIWPIQYGSAIASGLVADDAVFLAHVLYDDYARDRALDPYSQLQAAPPDGRYLKIQPWFLGRAELRVRGLPLPDGSFLALRVDGCSDPEGVPIEHVEPVYEAPEQNSEGSDQGESRDAVRSRRRVDPDSPVLTGKEPPGWDSPIATIRAPKFVRLGRPREVQRRPVVIGRSGPSGRTSSRLVTTFASGRPEGHGKDIGAAHISAPVALDSGGLLRDVWEALLLFRGRFDKRILSVEWFTHQTGFCSTDPPLLVPFPLVWSRAPRSVRRWISLDPNAPIGSATRRGLFVVRVVVRRDAGAQTPCVVWLVEIQRRPRAEEFAGLVFELDRAVDPRAAALRWINVLCSALPHTSGVFRKSLLDKCPGRAFVFKHSKCQISGEGAVRNALRKIGVSLP